MIKKRLSKLLMILLCAVLVMPLCTSVSKVKADGEVINAYYGVDFSYTVKDEHLSAKKSKVTITASAEGEDAVEIYKDGSIKNDNPTFILTSYENGKITARITKAGTYTFVVKSIKESEAETEFSDEQKIKVWNDINAKFESTNVDVFDAPMYMFDTDKLNEYQSKVDYATVADPEAENKASLFVGDSYTVPSIENLLDLGSFSYSQYRKTVYYLAPGSMGYTSTNASGTTDAKFNITKVGSYRFYVTLSLDEIDGRSFNLGVQDLKEYADGWYTMRKAGSEDRVYLTGSDSTIKYYTDEEHTEEYNGEVEKGVRLVPIFEFKIENAGPKITFDKTYQEDGYTGLEYSSISPTILGNDLTITYTLLYSADDGKTWSEAEEEYDSTNNKFVPEKLGLYKVTVKAVDGEGNTAENTSGIIKVAKKYENVAYKTSFKDWIKVNYLPFIFLCISGLCLIGIILLIFIKPKEAGNKFTEEDK